MRGKRLSLFLSIFAFLFVSSFGLYRLINREKFPEKQQKIQIVVVPHYPAFAGKTEKLLREKVTSTIKEPIEEIIIVGPNHKDVGKPIISGEEKEFLAQEHSIFLVEPILKKVFPEAKITSLILRNTLNLAEVEEFSQTIRNKKEKNLLLVLSIDFSHYLNQEEAIRNDMDTVGLINNYQVGQILSLGNDHLDCPPCLATGLVLAKENDLETNLIENTYQSGTSYFWLVFSPSFTSLSPSETTPLPKSPSSKELPKEITLLALGDIALVRDVNWLIQKEKNPRLPFEKIAPFTKEADIVFGNLEGPLIADCPIIRDGFKFCGDKENREGLFYAGISLVNLANNHTNNFGNKAISETKDNLSEKLIKYFANDEIAYHKTALTSFAFLGYDDTLSRVDEENVALGIAQVKNNHTDIVIVSFHWGEEYKKEPNERQRFLAQKAIDTGADIVIGHHPHVVQPLEYYQGKPIFYSLGNFVFDQLWSEETRKGAMGKITLKDNKIIETALIPIYINDQYQPEIRN